MFRNCEEILWLKSISYVKWSYLKLNKYACINVLIWARARGMGGGGGGYQIIYDFAHVYQHRAL